MKVNAGSGERIGHNPKDFCLYNAMTWLAIRRNRARIRISGSCPAPVGNYPDPLRLTNENRRLTMGIEVIADVRRNPAISNGHS